MSSTVEVINQSVYHVSKQDKLSLLIKMLGNPEIDSLLVFTQMKHAANKLAKKLSESNIPADAIHGNKSQNARQLALENFKKGKIRVLVATDIAARGIDIDELGHVLNFELPNVPETYVHRIGRTGRAGLSGMAYSFCAPEEKVFLNAIEKLIRKNIPTASHEFTNSQPRVSAQNTRPPVKTVPKNFNPRYQSFKKLSHGRILE